MLVLASTGRVILGAVLVLVGLFVLTFNKRVTGRPYRWTAGKH